MRAAARVKATQTGAPDLLEVYCEACARSVSVLDEDPACPQCGTNLSPIRERPSFILPAWSVIELNAAWELAWKNLQDLVIPTRVAALLVDVDKWVRMLKSQRRWPE